MKAHHGSARRNLSEDFGIAIAMSFAERTLACREHYFLDAIPNAEQFGFPAGKRPDIGSVTTSGSRILTEAKGSMDIKQLTPRAGRVEPAKLVRDSYRQLTGSGRASSSAPTRLFLAVTSPIAAGRSVGLEAAEYVTTSTLPCSYCDFDGANDDEAFGSTSPRRFEPRWFDLAAEIYRRIDHLVGGTRADLDDSREYYVVELATAGVTIGLHRRVAEAASNRHSILSDQLQGILDGLPEASIDSDGGRFADGTLTRANWPETERDDQNEDEVIE